MAVHVHDCGHRRGHPRPQRPPCLVALSVSPLSLSVTALPTASPVVLGTRTPPKAGVVALAAEVARGNQMATSPIKSSAARPVMTPCLGCRFSRVGRDAAVWPFLMTASALGGFGRLLHFGHPPGGALARERTKTARERRQRPEDAPFSAPHLHQHCPPHRSR